MRTDETNAHQCDGIKLQMHDPHIHEGRVALDPPLLLAINGYTDVPNETFGSGAHPTSCPMGTGALTPGVKRPGREDDYSPPSSAEVKNTWSYTSTLHGVVYQTSCAHLQWSTSYRQEIKMHMQHTHTNSQTVAMLLL
jgi:hypothetical protein